MFLIGLIFILFITFLVYLIGNTYGNRQLNREQQELEIMRLKQQLNKQALETELTQKKEIATIAEKLIADEQYYMNGLQDEIKRIETNLNELEMNQIPTREQMETWLFMMKASNRMNNQQANEILKLYDVKRIYPESKEDLR